MKQVTMMFVVILTGCARFALAGTKPNQEPGMLFWVLAAVVGPMLIYTGNKWRLFGLGFRLGMANKSTFLSSVKWTFASVVVTGVSLFVLKVTGSM